MLLTPDPPSGLCKPIESGEFVAVMGPSGGGEVHADAHAGGLDKPTSGKVWLDGIDLSELDDKQLTVTRRQKIGFIFQSFNLIPVLTAGENVALLWKRLRAP